MIFFSFLPMVGLWSAPAAAGGGAGSEGSLCEETLINGEEGQMQPHQGYSLENLACIQHELIYIFAKPALAERFFIFSQAAEFFSRDRIQADSNLNFTILTKCLTIDIVRV